MLNRNAAVSGLVLAAAGFVGACADTAPTEPKLARPSFSTQSSIVQQARPGLDALFEELARQQLPGFGGLFLDEAGRLVVYMTRTEEGNLPTPAEVLAKLGPIAGPMGIGGPASQLTVAEGEYDFVELAAWSERALPVLGLSGVVFTDIDESENRLRIGIESGTPESRVEAVLETLGVPLEAVSFEVVDPIVPLSNHTLRDRVRPLAGGLQLLFPNPMPGFVSVCTLGFNVELPGMRRYHFITNSHCSLQQGTVENTPYYQQPVAVLDPAQLIGHEVLDPPFFTSPCFAGFRCRWSDAAMARYDQHVPRDQVAFGQIYRTLSFGSSAAGSIEIDPVLPRFFIVDEAPFPLMGQTLNKVGRTTGWTRGNVIGTCLNVGVSGTAPPIAMLCQDLVQAASAGGDSGSPVFEQIGTTNHVRLYGILWGGSTTSSVFSAMDNIRFELGAFSTF